MRILILFVFVFLSIKNFAQSNVHIHIKNSIIPDSGTITVFKPIDGYYNDKIPYIHKLALKGEFSVDVPLDTTGFVIIRSQLGDLNLFLTPGDSMNITTEDKKLKFARKVNFQQSLIGKMPSYNIVFDFIKNTLSKTNATSQALDSINSFINKYQTASEKLFKENLVQKHVNIYNKLYVESYITFMISNDILLALSSKTPEKFKTQYNLSQENLKLILSEILDQYDPYNPKYKSLVSNAFLRRYKAMHLESIGGKKYKTPGIFTMLDSNFTYIDYAPKNIQEKFIVEKILLSISQFTLDYSIIEQSLQKFQESFPGSTWLPILRSSVEEYKVNSMYAQEASTISNKIVFYDQVSNQLLDNNTLTGISDLPSLIKQFANGQPVLVDCWATWCGPCIQQFKYISPLHKFLHKRGIKILYLSFDLPQNKKYLSWIKKYRLYGYHALKNKGIESSLQSYFKDIITIPRYLLFDANGNLLNGEILLPQKQKLMYDQIDDILMSHRSNS